MFIQAHDFALVCPNLSYSNYQKGGTACTLKPLSAACLGTHCDRRHYSHKLWRAARSWVLRFAIDLGKTDALIGIIEGYSTARVTSQGADPPWFIEVPVPGQTYVTPLTDARRFLSHTSYAELIQGEGGRARLAEP